MYDTLADVYDWLVPESLLAPEGSAAAFDAVLRELSPGARVLDCACGTGTLAVGLALRGFDVTASDASEAMVVRARALAATHGARVEASARRWEELEGGPFDAVFCVGSSIAHARDRRAALTAMRGVLRERGGSGASGRGSGGLLALTSTRAPRTAASARARATIASLASEAVTSKPRSASPTASVPVPHAQSSTRASGDSSPRTISNAAALPSGASSDSGTSQS